MLGDLSRYAPVVRLNSICPYYTMFPLSFPLSHLKEASPGDWVLDPFCGRGTTNYAARLCGLPAVGIDSHAVATAIAAAKLVSVTAAEILGEARSILEQGPAPAPEGPFWSAAFDRRTLGEICRLREALLQSSDSPARVALRAVMLGILHGPRHRRARSYLSNQMPRTYATKPRAAVRFWDRRNLAPEYVDTLALIARRAAYTFAGLPPAAGGFIRCGDSRDPATYRGLPSFHWIITSPPYYGMRNYRSDQWLRNWFLGGPDTVDYDRTGQMGAQPAEDYVRDLAQVWDLVATVSAPRAHLITRFGVLPGSPGDPASLACESLESSAWAVERVVPAGRPGRGRRQAEQFARPGKGPEEVDLVAIRR